MRVNIWIARNTTDRDAFYAVAWAQGHGLSKRWGKGEYAPGRGQSSTTHGSRHTFHKVVNEKTNRGYEQVLSASVDLPGPGTPLPSGYCLVDLAAKEADYDTHMARVGKTTFTNTGTPVPTFADPDEDWGDTDDTPLPGPRDADYRKQMMARVSITLGKVQAEVIKGNEAMLGLLSTAAFSEEEELIERTRSLNNFLSLLKEGVEELESHVEMFTDLTVAKLEVEV